MKIYKIKSEDKAALLNRLEKLGVTLDNGQIKDRAKLDGDNVIKYFEITVDNPDVEAQIDSILKQSPSIDKVTEVKKIIQNLIREELKNLKSKE